MITLKEQLEKYIPRKINVKIGANNGFIYCGPCDENIIDTVEKASNDYYSGLLARIQKLERYLANFDDLWDARIELLLKQWIKSKEKQPIARMIEKYREKLELKKEKDLSQKINLLKKVQEEEKKFMAFLMRKVVKTYGVDPTCDPDCTSKDKIIIFEGKEGGTYWTIKEYQEGTVTGEVDEI